MIIPTLPTLAPLLEPVDPTEFILACEEYVDSETVIDDHMLAWVADTHRGGRDVPDAAFDALDVLREAYRQSAAFADRVAAHLEGNEQW